MFGILQGPSRRIGARFSSSLPPSPSLPRGVRQLFRWALPDLCYFHLTPGSPDAQLSSPHIGHDDHYPHLSRLTCTFPFPHISFFSYLPEFYFPPFARVDLPFVFELQRNDYFVSLRVVGPCFSRCNFTALSDIMIHCDWILLYMYVVRKLSNHLILLESKLI